MKDYLVQTFQQYPEFLETLQEGDTIVFDMPSFCSGDYSAKVHKDSNGLYIKHKDNFLNGCRDFFKMNNNDTGTNLG